MLINHAVIMAAAAGKGMDDLTRSRPRALLPVAGKPIVGRLMDGLLGAGVKRFTVIVGEDEGEVAVWLTTRWRGDAEVTFTPRGPQHGTAAALFAARSHITEPFLITSCETLFDDQSLKLVVEAAGDHPGEGGMLCLHHTSDSAAEVGSVLLDPLGRVIFVSEKPSGGHQNHMTALPCYVFRPEIVEFLDRLTPDESTGERALPVLIQMMIDSGETVGAITVNPPMSLRSISELLAANLALLQGLSASVLYSDVPSSVTIHPPVYVEAEVKIGEGAVIGPNVFLEKGSRIGPHVHLEDSIVLGVRVGNEKYITGEVVYEETL